MKICVLLPHGENADSPVVEFDTPYDPTPFLKGHEFAVHALRKATIVRQIETLHCQGYDLFFNLCDGLSEENLPGIQVVQTLERLAIPFTGAGSGFYEPSRQQFKESCLRLGLPTPAFAFIHTPDETRQVAHHLRYPLIVKHPDSFSSIGLTPQSRVENPAELQTQVEQMIAAYGNALVEEFIVGREFAVLITENPDDPACPVIYQAVELCFPPGETFYHFHLKWVNYRSLATIPVNDVELDQRLRALTGQIFLGMNGTGYARFDIRMNEQGELFLLDVNPNCAVYYPLDQSSGSADLILTQSPGGHQAFTDLLLRSALKRAGRPWK